MFEKNIYELIISIENSNNEIKVTKENEHYFNSDEQYKKMMDSLLKENKELRKKLREEKKHINSLIKKL